MFVKDVTVENQVGLHARPATFFIQKANEFKSSIWVEKRREELTQNPYSAYFHSASWAEQIFALLRTALTRKRLLRALLLLLKAALQSKIVKNQAGTVHGRRAFFFTLRFICVTIIAQIF